jgi:Fe-S oxidoreductase
LPFVDKETQTEETWVLDEELWEELLALTDGAAAPCFQCGVCTATCPWGLVRDKAPSVRNIMRQAQLGLLKESEGLWLCTACAQCEPGCPRGVPIVEVLRSLRYLLWKRRATIEGLPSVLWSVYWNNNPWAQPPSQRALWAKDLEVPQFDSKQHELLYYVGCTSSYDRRAQQLARSLAMLLQAAGVSYGILGEKEPCCGESVLSLGHKPYFEELTGQAAKVFQDSGVTEMMTTSPHCYDVFQGHFPPQDESFSPHHYTQYLAHLVQEDRLSFQKDVPVKVTFQDPCFLGRWHQAYEAPRRLLAAIPGLELIEMTNHGPDALCCGGGGGRMWMETAAGERFSDLRVREAAETGAGVIATACPFCISCLEDSIKALKLEDLKVLDIAEIAVQALPGGD